MGSQDAGSLRRNQPENHYLANAYRLRCSAIWRSLHFLHLRRLQRGVHDSTEVIPHRRSRFICVMAFERFENGRVFIDARLDADGPDLGAHGMILR